MLSYRTIDQAFRRVPSHQILGQLPHMHEGNDLGQPWMESERQYSVYEAIGRLHKPKRVLEIGVRYGYALVALTKGCPEIEAVDGVDNGGYGIAECNRKAEENIRAGGFKGKIALYLARSDQWFERNNGKMYDLIHIDGDHSFETVSRDIRTAWTQFLSPKGVLLVDDFGIPDVNEAAKQVEKFEYDAHFEFPTHNRLLVAVKS